MTSSIELAAEPPGSAECCSPVAAVSALLDELRSLLEQEFEVLKGRTIDQLEEMQERKVRVLSSLEPLMGELGPEGMGALPSEASAAAAECRRLHLRNETVLVRKLDAVRGALEALRQSADDLMGDLYDRSGRQRWAPGYRAASRARMY